MMDDEAKWTEAPGGWSFIQPKGWRVGHPTEHTLHIGGGQERPCDSSGTLLSVGGNPDWNGLHQREREILKKYEEALDRDEYGKCDGLAREAIDLLREKHPDLDGMKD